MMWYVAAILTLIALPAWAQEQIDPRVAQPLVKALQAEIALRDAAISAMAEDLGKREKDLADWFRGYFATPEKEAK